MRLSTALFASIVAICCTVGVVNSQIMFADGSVQTTAFGGIFSIPTGDAFSYYQSNTAYYGSNQVSNTVPSGRELVILKIYARGDDKRLEVRADGSETQTLVDIDLGTFNIDVPTKVLDFPNGSCVVDEGYQLWFFDPYGYSELHILGYYRDK